MDDRYWCPNRFWTSTSFFKSAPISCSSFSVKLCELIQTFFTASLVYPVGRCSLSKFTKDYDNKAALPCTKSNHQLFQWTLYVPTLTPSFQPLIPQATPLAKHSFLAHLYTPSTIYNMIWIQVVSALYTFLRKWMENPLLYQLSETHCAWWNALVCAAHSYLLLCMKDAAAFDSFD